MPILAEKNECTGCMACVSACKRTAIRKVLKDDGHYYVEINKEKCIECQACQKVCLASRKEYGANDLSKSKVYGAFAADPIIRSKSTSGGIFTAIAYSFIKDGGVVIGASFDGKNCKHICIDDVKRLPELQGSKYVSSDMEGIHSVIENELKSRNVLFSGVGCQCASVLAFFNEKKCTHNLYTIDLICGGYPSRILLDKYFRENPQVAKIKSFRNKERYELCVFQDDKEIIDNTKNLPLNGFSCALTNRWSCYNCQFAKAHRKTNITIGDLWDKDVMRLEHEDGISTVIVHNSQGSEILNKANVVYKEIPWEKVLLSNSRIVQGKQLVFYPREKLEELSTKLSYEDFRKLYCIAMTYKDVKYFLFRIYRYICNKILGVLTLRLIKRLLRKENMST